VCVCVFVTEKERSSNFQFQNLPAPNSHKTHIRTQGLWVHIRACEDYFDQVIYWPDVGAAPQLYVKANDPVQWEQFWQPDSSLL